MLPRPRLWVEHRTDLREIHTNCMMAWRGADQPCCRDSVTRSCRTISLSIVTSPSSSDLAAPRPIRSRPIAREPIATAPIAAAPTASAPIAAAPTAPRLTATADRRARSIGRCSFRALVTIFRKRCQYRMVHQTGEQFGTRLNLAMRHRPPHNLLRSAQHVRGPERRSVFRIWRRDHAAPAPATHRTRLDPAFAACPTRASSDRQRAGAMDAADLPLRCRTIVQPN